MAAAFQTWTVLPHGPVERFSENLWRVRGDMPNPENKRVMVLARLADGRIVMHNAIALEEERMAEIDAWGEVAAILVPNAFHRQDAKIMKDRYPGARVYAPAGGAGAVAKVVPVDGSYSDAPGDATVTVRHLAGIKEREGVVTVRSNDGVSAIFCDTVLNLPKMSGLLAFALHPTGQPAVPRVTRWLFTRNAAELKADLEQIASVDGLTRVICGHGAAIVADAPGAMRSAIATLD